MKPLSIFLTLIALNTLTACSSLSQSPAIGEHDFKTCGHDANRAYQKSLERITDRLASRLLHKKRSELNILLLSGGGQNGAYGIGFLRGWQQKDGLPQFDLVSGVSTGALQAPFALIGTKEALNEASILYKRAAGEFAPTFDWLFWLKDSGGRTDTRLYEQVISNVLDGPMSIHLKSEFVKERQLIVGTSDLNLGVGKIWELNENLHQTQKILLASTAIPGIFPPQILEDHVHSDGGVVSSLLPILNFKDYQHLIAKARQRGLSKKIKINLWVIMNMWTHPPASYIDARSPEALSKRAQSLRYYLDQPQSLMQLKELSRLVSQLPGVEMNFHATAIPSQLSSRVEALELFNSTWMNELEDIGYTKAQSSSAWDPVISSYIRPAIQ